MTLAITAGFAPLVKGADEATAQQTNTIPRLLRRVTPPTLGDNPQNVFGVKWRQGDGVRLRPVTPTPEGAEHFGPIGPNDPGAMGEVCYGVDGVICMLVSAYGNVPIFCSTFNLPNYDGYSDPWGQFIAYSDMGLLAEEGYEFWGLCFQNY